ncbi:MAG: mechanosensitive ion channel domain-containing protein [Balneolaceae bacterium]
MDLLTESNDLILAGNELWRIVMMVIAIAASLIAGKILKFSFSRTAPRLKSRGQLLLSVVFVSASKSVTFVVFSFGLSVALSFLVLPEGIEGLVFTAAEVLIVLSIGYFVYRLVDVVDAWLVRFAQTNDESQIDDMLIPIVGKSLRVTVVILIILQSAQALSDKPITSILAGIGIGGLALGLAAQDTIRNFFGSLMIFADKPFDVGDLINLDDTLGVINEVGVRTTKMTTLDGHMLTVPNGQLANITIHNIGRRPYIRRVFSVTVTYDTTPDMLDRAVDILKDILDNHEGMNEERPPRVYFDDLKADSLNLICFYWYHPPDYWQYMEFTEKVNRQIFRRFNEEGIDFAFPTQTIFLAGDKDRPLDVGVKNDSSDEPKQ